MPLIDRILDAIMAAILFAAVVVAFLAVIFRYVIGSALVWSFELSLALLTYMTFIGCYAALRRDAHLRVDVVVRRLPLVPQTTFFVLAHLMILLVAGVMVYWGAKQLLLFGHQTTTVMAIPRGVLYAIIPISGFAMATDSLYRLVVGLRRALGGMPPEDPDAGFSLDREESPPGGRGI